MKVALKQAAIFLFFLSLFTSGLIDIDWIIVENHYQMWNATKETWEFCPYLTMNWWTAYAYTLLRIIIGAIYIGYHIRRLGYES